MYKRIRTSFPRRRESRAAHLGACLSELDSRLRGNDAHERYATFSAVFALTRELSPCVYILASQPNGTLYIGVTSDLVKRVWQHREKLGEGFTEKYDVAMLVWYEQHPSMESEIAREKQLKKWNRAWKLKLIERSNAQWKDLWLDIV